MSSQDSAESVETLLPTVLWAQRKQMIMLRVQIQPLEKPEFTVHEEYMTFKGLGVGVSGKASYVFELVFCEPVNTENLRVRFSETEIEFRILKKTPTTWPRLQAASERPHWIRVDFEHYQGEDDSENEEGEGQEEEPGKKERMAKTQAELDEIQKMMKKETARYNSAMKLLQQVKKAYLVAYNGVQWSGFILIVITLLKCARGGMEGIQTAYDQTATMLMFCQALAILEIVNAAFGLTKGGLMAPLFQVGGRFLILFIVLQPAEEIHKHVIVFVLFLAWSLVELIRYPYYALSVLEFEVEKLTWLRYSAWIPLYPVGFTCEAITVWLALPHFDNSDDYHYPLPNPLNMSFHPATVMRIGLFLLPIVSYSLITHMVAQRKRKLAKPKSA